MEPSSDQSQISRRDFLTLTKEVAKGLTAAALVSSIRSSFAPRPKPPEITPALQPPEKAVIYEKEIKDRLVESMLQKLTVMDTGKPVTGEPLSELDVWRIITGNLTITQEEFEARQNVASSLELSYHERVARHYLYQAAHGKVVMDSLRTGLATAADYHGDAVINFLPKATPEQADKLYDVQEFEEKWYSDSGETRGPQLVIDSPPPEVDVESGEIISGSFQFGKAMIAFAEESLSIENDILTHNDVRNFLKKQVDYHEAYNEINAPTGEFILPVGKSLKDITSITVVKTQDGNVVDQTDIAINYSEEKQENPFNSKVTSDTAPIEQYTIHLNSGESIEINPDPQKEDYTETWTRIESLTDRPPEKILGAFNKENPFRSENIQKLKEFLRNHPNNFWVFAIGNHADILTEEDMVDMPENCIHVGQAITAENNGERYYSGTFGSSIGNSQTIFVTNTELGITGSGSSLATPQIAAAASLYSIDNQSKPIKRTELIKYLQDKGAIQQYEWLVPYYEGQTESESWQVNMLNIPGYTNLIDQTVKMISTEVKTTSRRDFLRGKFTK